MPRSGDCAQKAGARTVVGGPNRGNGGEYWRVDGEASIGVRLVLEQPKGYHHLNDRADAWLSMLA